MENNESHYNKSDNNKKMHDVSLKDRPVIKIVGIGGAGCNMVSNMAEELGDLLPQENFIAMNTDAQSLVASKAKRKVQLGDNGLGAGSDPQVGRESAEYSSEEIRRALDGANLVIIVFGCGGGTGSGAGRVVSALAQEMGALVIGILTKPFSFEGKKRGNIALEAIDEFKPHADVTVVVSNQLLFMVTTEYTTFKEAFKIVDKMCSSFVRSIVEILEHNGLINVDFADIKSIIKNKGSGAIGIGYGENESAAIDAAKNALSNQLLEKVSIKEASNALVHILGNDITLHDIELVMDTIGKEMNENVHIIHGISLYNGSDNEVFFKEHAGFSGNMNNNLVLNHDGGIDTMNKKWIRVMIIATGLSFDHSTTKPMEEKRNSHLHNIKENIQTTAEPQEQKNTEEEKKDNTKKISGLFDLINAMNKNV